VELNLIDRRCDRSDFQNGLDVLRKIVGETDGLGEALGFERFENLPLGLVIFRLRCPKWCVDQVSADGLMLFVIS
jgi:hypothetical protein